MKKANMILGAALVAVVFGAAAQADQGAGDAGRMKADELTPQRYPAQPQVAGKTRDEVKTGLAESVRTGDFPVGESGQKANEIRPQHYLNIAPNIYAHAKSGTTN